MKPDTIAIMDGLLSSALNETQGVLLHLEHQAGLPIELRVIEMPPAELEEKITYLREEFFKLRNAKTDFSRFAKNQN